MLKTTEAELGSRQYLQRGSPTGGTVGLPPRRYRKQHRANVHAPYSKNVTLFLGLGSKR